MTSKRRSGPKELYPKLGTMRYVTVYLPEKVIEWAGRHPRGLSAGLRDSVLAAYQTRNS